MAPIDANGLARFEQIEPGIYEMRMGPAGKSYGSSHLLRRRFEVNGPKASFVIEELPAK